MKAFLVTTAILAILTTSGCADDFWCGENGCGANKEANMKRTT